MRNRSCAPLHVMGRKLTNCATILLDAVPFILNQGYGGPAQPTSGSVPEFGMDDNLLPVSAPPVARLTCRVAPHAASGAVMRRVHSCTLGLPCCPQGARAHVLNYIKLMLAALPNAKLYLMGVGEGAKTLLDYGAPRAPCPCVPAPAAWERSGSLSNHALPLVRSQRARR